MKLKDKVAVVTGASEGIGRAIALKLAEKGTSLALMARTQKKLLQAVKEAEEAGASHVGVYACDIRDSSQLEDGVRKVISDFKTVDILVNNAGIWQKLNYLEDIPKETVKDVIDTNLTGLIQVTRLFLPHLKERQEAAIINISSRSGVTAQPGQTIYCASKWGVKGFTEVLKVDLKDTNIRVAGIYQGGVATKLLEKAGDKISTDKYTEPSDLAGVIVYMLSRPPKLWLHEVRIEY